MNWGHPLKAVFQILWVVPVHKRSPDKIGFFGPRFFVVDCKLPFTIRVHNIRVGRVGNSRSRFTSSCILDIAQATGLHTIGRHTWNRNGGIIILHASIQPVRILVIYFYLIYFSGRLIVLCRPSFPSGMGNIGTAVVTLDKQIRIVWIDPHIMIISMGRR